ncbi:MAG: DNA repair protein RecO [Flavobacteriales bacterium]|nr:DNA repair protein RecO [Flavobacteriales bacterium]
MEIADSAIILGTIEVKNNNNIVKMFTQDYGLVSVYLASGIKKKSARNAVLQPLSICQVVYSNNKNTSIPKLKEANIETPLLSIQMDIYKSAIALFLSDFLQMVLPKDQEDGLFDFLCNSIKIFNEIEDGKINYHLTFLLKISKWLGIQPTLNKERNNFFDLKEGLFLIGTPNHPYYLSSAETQIFAQFLQSNWSNIGCIKLTGTQRRKLLNSLIKYYTFHISGFRKPKSLTILEEVFS